MLARACAEAGRTLTEAERRRFYIAAPPECPAPVMQGMSEAQIGADSGFESLELSGVKASSLSAEATLVDRVQVRGVHVAHVVAGESTLASQGMGGSGPAVPVMTPSRADRSWN